MTDQCIAVFRGGVEESLIDGRRTITSSRFILAADRALVAPGEDPPFGFFTVVYEKGEMEPDGSFAYNFLGRGTIEDGDFVPCADPLEGIKA